MCNQATSKRSAMQHFTVLAFKAHIIIVVFVKFVMVVLNFK